MKSFAYENFSNPDQAKIGVVGLGYVGLPLACLLASKYKVIGLDIDSTRIEELRKGHDRTGEVQSKSDLCQPSLTYSSDHADLSHCDVIIVAVPTPVDEYKRPDLAPLVSASRSIGSALAHKSPIIVFESTVYPGVTEDVCCPEIAAASGREMGKGFHLGYSPERVNPGDKVNTIAKIKKVVSGSRPEVAQFLAQIYGSVITAGVHVAPSIRVAEAAKVIENTQRDVNIALVNELSMLFERIGVDTQAVLEAARTKWNFLDFRPGLVGGHCIGVDPYYLTHLAAKVGHHCHLINAGRRINDDMGRFIAEKTVAMLLQGKTGLSTSPKALICGVTFKENVPDTRNTRVVDLAETLSRFGIQPLMYDPVADERGFEHEYGTTLEKWQDVPQIDALILAVKHREFTTQEFLSMAIDKLKGPKVVIDIKGILDKSLMDPSQFSYWRP